MQIVPGIFLVNGFPYRQHQNSYVVAAGDGCTLIDSGDLESRTFDLVLANCRRWNLDPARLRHLLITHAHFDHSSHAAEWQRRGVSIVANADCAAAMAAGDDRCVGYAVHRVFEPCRADRVVADGDIVESGGLAFRCIAAPGHAASCMVYELRIHGQIVLFVGDNLLTGHECQSVELGWPGGPDCDRAAYVETLRRLAHLDCDILLPGHGPPCIGDGRRMLEMAYTKAMLSLR